MSDLRRKTTALTRAKTAHLLSAFGIGLCLMLNPAQPLKAEPYTSAAANVMNYMANMMGLMMMSPGGYGGWSPYSMYNPWGYGSGMAAPAPAANSTVPNVIVPPTVIAAPASTTTATTVSTANQPAIAIEQAPPVEFDQLKNQPSLFGNAPANQNVAQTSPGNFWLNGQYRANSGEILRVNGKQFQMLSRFGSLAGLITSNGDLVALHVPQQNQTLFFQVQLTGNTLMLREPSGNTQTFVRFGP